MANVRICSLRCNGSHIGWIVRPGPSGFYFLTWPAALEQALRVSGGKEAKHG